MKDFLVMVYIQEDHSESEDSVKDSNFQWMLFVIHKLLRYFVMGLYGYKSLPLYNICLETVHINNQKIFTL